MTPAEFLSEDMADAVQELRSKAEPFAFATIVRTAGATAARPGAKALLDADGTIVHGWLGGGCTKGAVQKAALSALRSGQPQLVSIAPEELLAQKGINSGDELDGVKFTRNGCPSKGSIDIFIEPCLPIPQLVILGKSPVANALANLAPQFHWAVSTNLNEDKLTPVNPSQFIVVATQGQGDIQALKQALDNHRQYVAFVGSKRRYEVLASELIKGGASANNVHSVNAPAGLDLGAVTPEEIALSILAELVRARRAKIDINHV